VRRRKDRGAEISRDQVDQALIEQCKSGDQEAWSQLVEVTHREVYTLCLRILGNSDDAAEATQDAYLKVYRGLPGFRGDAMFSTWLYRVATNAAISKQRGRSRRRAHEAAVDEDVMAQLPSSVSVEDAAGARVEVGVLERALAALPDMYREAVLLRDVYGLSIEEIAGQLKISETAAKVRVHRGRKKLREKMWPDEPGAEGRDET
jgi:RNA polymerase sigma-70 factor (ECF subfamily)